MNGLVIACNSLQVIISVLWMDYLSSKDGFTVGMLLNICTL